MQKVRFIYNPKSGETVISEWLDHIIEIYQGHGYTVVPYRLCFGDTEETDMFDGVDQSYHHALIAGGDGTVNYVVNVMKRRGVKNASLYTLEKIACALELSLTDLVGNSDIVTETAKTNIPADCRSIICTLPPQSHELIYALLKQIINLER